MRERGNIPMTLLQLQYFTVLSETLHYTRASEKLHISQPSLSYAIGELEKDLGVKLFQKENRKVALTAYGQQFLSYVEKSLALLSEGEQVIRQMVENAPQIVNFGYFHSVSVPLVPSIVDGFFHQKQANKIRFQFAELSSYDVLSRIQDGTLDLGLSLHRADWAESIGIMRQPLYLAVPAEHRFAERTSISFIEFAKEPQIMIERSTNIRSNIEQLYARNNIVPNIVFEVRECNSAIQYVALGFGVSIMPWVPAMETNRIKIIPISERDEEFVRTVYLTYHKTRPLSPSAQEVCDYIIKNYAL